MLRSTASILTGSVAVAWFLWATPSVAGPAWFTNGVALGMAATGQTGAASEESRRREADELLTRAREAMAQNDLAAAELLIGRAEALGLEYGPFHLKDTPEKARRDLERLQASSEPRGASFPFGRSQPPANDPFSGRSELRPEPLPPVGQLTTMPPANAAPSADGNRAESDRALVEAREALAVGDVRTARGRVEEARRLGVVYDLRSDSPDKVEAAIDKYAALVAEPAERKNTESYRRQYARAMMEQAEELLRWREFAEAERLANLAARQNVNYGPYEATPQTLLERIAAAARQRTQDSEAPSQYLPTLERGSFAVRSAGDEAVHHAGGRHDPQERAAHALYHPADDPTRNVPAAASQQAEGQPTPTGPGYALFQQGEAALQDGNLDRALDFFRQARDHRASLDPATAQRLDDHLRMLSQPGQEPPDSSGRPLAEERSSRDVAAEVASREAAARRMQERDPRGALTLLQETRQSVRATTMDTAAQQQLLRRLDRTIEELSSYLEHNRAQLELDERNRGVRAEMQHDLQLELDVQERLGLMVDEFNQLMDEQRFEEAEVIAKRAAELDPRNPVVQQLIWQSRFVRRFHNNMAIRDAKEQGFISTMESVDRSSIPFDDREPLVFPDLRDWRQLTDSRARQQEARERVRSEREIEIEQKLRTPVSLEFTDAPLGVVLEHLATISGVNMHIDPLGISEEGVTSDVPVTINLREEISLRSALNLILQPLHLSYVIRDEVLKITSAQTRDQTLVRVVYPVGDLVIPIPHFVPTPGGLDDAYRRALDQIGYRGPMGGFSHGAPPLAVTANHKGGRGTPGALNPNILAQMSSAQGGTMGGAAGMPLGFGPAGSSGGGAADFGQLIELIENTVQPDSWQMMGGPGQIAPFEGNMSLVISQTQAVHEEIVDLLAQLRRLQDLQVTIEVRFISLNDSFFERIGVHFEFDIDSDAGSAAQLVSPGIPAEGVPPTYDLRRPGRDRSVTVGMEAPNIFSADLDIPFRQNSFGLGVPQFGGFDPSAGAELGFAILSDIEAFFFINAAQADRRTNVLQAPKVTLFNGQQAMISDTSQSPFVISVQPVVGDFAAALQPIIVVLTEGTYLTVQAVVSDDRRFVRLTVVPYFSTIDPDVRTFQFTGRTTTTTDTSQEGWWQNPEDDDDIRRDKDDRASTTTSEGTTVQLPTVAQITVTTTVSVPDGGTVLLGGIKRLSEGRTEAGVPILNKVPYINRLFRNSAIGRETQSLMMMVTPRIIIQEEEEERLGVVIDR